ncbi:MAG: GNAT family N-acetyltransferase [Halobacteriota archaeon]
MTNLKNKKIKIEGKKIYLKVLDEENATQEYCDWLNDPEVNEYLETKEATVEELKRYIKEKKESPNCLFLGIILKENNKHIGNIKLEPIDFNDKKATLGILMGDKEYWGIGIGTEATKLLVGYAFNSLDLKEVNLGVLSENKAAIKVYKKAGFQIDRIEKKSTFMSIKK